MSILQRTAKIAGCDYCMQLKIEKVMENDFQELNYDLQKK